MLPFDLTRRITFEQLPKWIALVKENLSVPIILMGNKADLNELREVDREDAIKFAEDTRLSSYIETSAKTGENVERAFEILAKEMYKRFSYW